LENIGKKGEKGKSMEKEILGDDGRDWKLFVH
jgi:hypothetical protein